MNGRANLFLRIPQRNIKENQQEELTQQFTNVFPNLTDDPSGSVLPIRDIRERLERIEWKSDVNFGTNDLVFWVHVPIGHWYDFHYPRGDFLPLVLLASWWLEKRVPQGEVYYGGGPEEAGRLLTASTKGALMYHFCRYGKRWHRYLERPRREGTEPAVSESEECQEMLSAYRSDFGALRFTENDLEPTWAAINWRGLAFRWAVDFDYRSFRPNRWQMRVPDLRRDDLAPLLTSFDLRRRVAGIRLASEVGGLSYEESSTVLEPLLAEEHRFLLLVDLLDSPPASSCLPEENKQEILAALLAAEMPAARMAALPLAEKIGGRTR